MNRYDHGLDIGGPYFGLSPHYQQLLVAMSLEGGAVPGLLV